ncbi:MurR/RpiR family transcriptional regulator [Sinisalibacter lacisalsi]|uniref:Transcriptional regulator n=1 Tax=Sinisalibacter lacisalsi TaxID=1526570 RepID=A0ABQ1QSS2_9RHOB|nr:MurR/RpiR family transcriptional regulator [Sinisalibacter lacisalsi]GGD40392.1 transcriptional regulator [Sinisalibacter lacisalsi]
MQQVIDIISKMRSLNGELRKREQRVADFVLSNLDQISFLTQGEIAQAAGVSAATVHRFCVSVGCEGFRDFKIRLAQSVAVSLQYLDGNSAEASQTDQLVSQVFGALVDMLNTARQQLDNASMTEAIALLAGARRIVFFGVGGGSANVAREGANRFFRLGLPAEAHADGYFQRMLASTLSTGDVVFAISASGQPQELLDSISIARQYGASSISLTKSGSDLANLTDVSIGIDIPEDQDIYKPSASRLVFIAIIDVLAAGAARERPEEVKEFLRRIRTSLVTLSKDTGPKPIGD